MNKTELNALFDTWKPRLGLDLWSIEILVVDFTPDNNIMRCCQSLNYNVANNIKVQPWVLTGKPPKNWHDGATWSENQIEKSVVHELLHCVHKPLDQWESLIDGQLHRDVFTVVQEAHEQAAEHVVDALACALVKEWPSTINK